MAMYPEQRMAQQVGIALRRDVEVAAVMGIPLGKLAGRVFVGLKEWFVGPRTAYVLPYLEVEVLAQPRTPYSEEGSEASSIVAIRCRLRAQSDHAERHQLAEIANTIARRLKLWHFDGFDAYPPESETYPTSARWFAGVEEYFGRVEQRGVVIWQDVELRTPFVLTRQDLGRSPFIGQWEEHVEVET